MSRIERIAAVAEGYVAQNLYSGIEWRVDVAGRTLSEGAVGSANHAAQTPIPEKAIYRIFSMTKPIVSLLALKLVEAGRLRLYDMVAQYDPRFAQLIVLTSEGRIVPAERPITIEDLLTHRAGFTYEFLHGCHIAQYYREARINADGSRSLSEMMDALAELPLAFQPGTAYRYGVSIDVLAAVCEVAGGDTLANLLDTHIFKPLGMEDTAFEVPSSKRDRLMSIYGLDILEGPPALAPADQVLNEIDLSEMYPVDRPDRFQRGGLGLFSTTSDYMAFANMLLDGKAPDGSPLISRKMHQMLKTNRIPEHQLPLAIGPNVMAGDGWGLIGRVRLGDGLATSLAGEGEFGWAGAATTYFWVDPAEQMTGVVMSQYLGSALPLTDDMRVAAYQAI